MPSTDISKRTFYKAAIKRMQLVKRSPLTVAYGFAGRQLTSQKTTHARMYLGRIPLYYETQKVVFKLVRENVLQQFGVTSV